MSNFLSLPFVLFIQGKLSTKTYILPILLKDLMNFTAEMLRL